LPTGEKAVILAPGFLWKAQPMQEDEGAILAQNPAPAPASHNTRRRWLIALSAVPLFGMAVAFGIAPDTDPHPVELKTVIETLELPATQALDTGEQTFWRQTRIQRGDTLGSLLARLEVDDAQAYAFLRASGEARSLTRLVPGRSIQAQTDADGRLLVLRYLAPDQTLLKVERQGERLVLSEGQAAVERHIAIKSAEIKSSLFEATDTAGIPDTIAIQLAEIFSSDIDFHLDIRRGDRFTVIYETLQSNGETLNSGRVLAAEFVNAGRTYQAVYFRDAEGHEGYYTPDGRSLRKAFLRSPLAFSRVTSGFTLARFHPVLKEWRAHKGVDYAAPTGTPVRAVADGTVVFAGRQNGYGNLIVLQHRGTISTAYGHLSAFARGLRKGSRVTQGETIGYVGATGMATGPHLHYEFRVAGVQRNPLTVPMPQAWPIAAQYRKAFLAQAAPLMERLKLVRGLNLASID
jgi:murein DD-endopeptidase MepM/ murein hydrolase activator NlpD